MSVNIKQQVAEAAGSASLEVPHSQEQRDILFFLFVSAREKRVDNHEKVPTHTRTHSHRHEPQPFFHPCLCRDSPFFRLLTDTSLLFSSLFVFLFLSPSSLGYRGRYQRIHATSVKTGTGLDTQHTAIHSGGSE